MNYKLAITAGLVIVIAVGGSIIWVQYIYLPHNSPVLVSATTPITQIPVTPSPKTEAALQAIQYLVQQHWPFLNSTPTPMTLSPVSSAVSSTYSYLGLTLSVPWSGAGTITEKGNPVTLVQIPFPDGRSITIMRSPTSSAATLAQWTSLSSTITTDYDLDSAAFNATPDQVISSTPDDQAVLTAALLALKTSLWISPGPIYSFVTGNVEGFQYGDATTTRPVGIELFDAHGNIFTLTVNGTPGEVDYILASSK